VIVVALVVAAVIVVALGLFALRRKRPLPVPVPQTPAWTDAAGSEFAALSEAERCDLIFAIEALDDEKSKRILESALADSSDAVALAAARALARRGAGERIQDYFNAHPGERSQRIAAALDLMALES
jgi:hypothetical protein